MVFDKYGRDYEESCGVDDGDLKKSTEDFDEGLLDVDYSENDEDDFRGVAGMEERDQDEKAETEACSESSGEKLKHSDLNFYTSSLLKMGEADWQPRSKTQGDRAKIAFFERHKLASNMRSVCQSAIVVCHGMQYFIILKLTAFQCWIDRSQ